MLTTSGSGWAPRGLIRCLFRSNPRMTMLRWNLLFIFVGLAFLFVGSARPATAQTVDTVHPATAPPDREAKQIAEEPVEMLAIDTLLYVENEGLTRIIVELNEYRFKLVTDSTEIDHSDNAFPIPEYGEITMNVAALVHPNEPNFVAFTSQGPENTEAQVVLSPVPVVGQTVAFAITTLDPLPAQFELLHNHPNPFRSRTTITYTIPDTRINGVDVHLAVYDARGRIVAVLVDDRRFPGRHTATWSPAPGTASGVFYGRLVAGTSQATIPMMLVR